MHLNELLKYENENDECENSHRQFQLFFLIKIKTWFR